MTFGISVLIVLATWSLLSIAVSVTIGRVAAFRDDAPATAARLHAAAERDDRERVAS